MTPHIKRWGGFFANRGTLNELILARDIISIEPHRKSETRPKLRQLVYWHKSICWQIVAWCFSVEGSFNNKCPWQQPINIFCYWQVAALTKHSTKDGLCAINTQKKSVFLTTLLKKKRTVFTMALKVFATFHIWCDQFNCRTCLYMK